MSDPTRDDQADPIEFICAQCKQTHHGLPAVAFDAPAEYDDIPEAERPGRTHKTNDVCIIDDEQFYVRAVLRIPIIDHDECFEWGVWGSLSETNFKRYQETFDDDNQSEIGAMFSWFANELPGYDETLNLQSQLIAQDGGRRPLVALHDDDDHPLAHDFHNGITLQRAIELVQPALPCH